MKRDKNNENENENDEIIMKEILVIIPNVNLKRYTKKKDQ